MMDNTQLDPALDPTVLPPPVTDPQPAVLPYWLFVAWLALLIATWPLVQKQWARRHVPPAADLARSFELFRQARFPQSIAAARRQLKLDPHSAEAFVNMGIAYANMGKPDEAIAATQQALLLKPGSELAWNNLRWILQRRATANPTAEAREDEAFAAYSAGNYGSCVELANRALRLFSTYSKAFNLLSVCYLNLGEYDKAIANAREAIRIEPAFALARNNLNLALDRKAAAHSPQPPPPLASSMTAEGYLASSANNYRIGRKRQCIDDARAALRLNPSLALAWNNIAACSNDLGRPDDAVTAAMKALQLQPDLQLARNNLAVALNLKKQSSQRKPGE
jgi:Flp pilus assembly protein TadD